ncbi:hypothetical protein DL766_002314 [Monosporascus sp. MC13-8B]|uniref:Ketoreductase (KR) domain-containing protein n=1 Tax=Monosporascus cannonballus TaxID=155416 RepID=A0ABY0HGB8_9PEZI|nr:hypothetical protein DL762_001899 [Monosporascus cannonballus]RYO99056.1 hypothetical protein DL763_001758 [Monosporascus cannonballus]RYP35847.1 hypothetical protein DL766_002314 [Monosporascus sp. MC13-8B]
MIDSNYFSCVCMAHAVFNAWLRSDATAKETNPQTDRSTPMPLPPRHLNPTGPFASFYSLAGFTPYSHSNAAIRTLSDSLSQEMSLCAAAHLYLPRVRVHTVLPATMPPWSLEDESRVKTDLTKSLEEWDHVLTQQECAWRATAGLESGEELVMTSTIVRLVMSS